MRSIRICSQFGLGQLLFVTAIIAIFFSIRLFGIRTEDQRVFGFAPIVVGILVAGFAGSNGASYFAIFGWTGLASLMAAASWAFECVLESPGSLFMRRHPQAQYTVDPELSAIVVAILTIVSTLIGGSLGSVVRYVRDHCHCRKSESWSRWHRSPNKRLNRSEFCLNVTPEDDWEFQPTISPG